MILCAPIFLLCFHHPLSLQELNPRPLSSNVSQPPSPSFPGVYMASSNLLANNCHSSNDLNPPFNLDRMPHSPSNSSTQSSRKKDIRNQHCCSFSVCALCSTDKQWTDKTVTRRGNRQRVNRQHHDLYNHYHPPSSYALFHFLSKHYPSQSLNAIFHTQLTRPSHSQSQNPTTPHNNHPIQSPNHPPRTSNT